MRKLVIDAIAATVVRVLNAALITAVVVLVARWMGVAI